MTGGLKIGELAQRAGVTGKAIRFYAAISAERARVGAFVIPTDEELVIARDIAECLDRLATSPGGRGMA